MFGAGSYSFQWLLDLTPYDFFVLDLSTFSLTRVDDPKTWITRALTIIDFTMLGCVWQKMK